MMPETLRYALIMLAAGIGIPILAALNAQLGSRISSPPAAAMVLFVVAFLAATAATVFTTGAGPLRLIASQPKHLFLGGLFVAFYVLSVTWIAPRFGLGNAVFMVLVGQMLAAAIIDHFGLLGALVKPFTLWRATGLGLMALGLLMVLRA